MTAWRQAGLNYIHFSGIAARVLRSVLKPELRDAAGKRELSYIKKVNWKDGKPITGKEAA